MSKNYTLIKDENETRKFIEKVLQPLKDDEVYIVVLTARKKYYPTISSSLEVVSRDIIRNNDTNKIIRKLKKLSIVEGIYTDKDNNIISIEAFALYILPEPRSMLKAYTDFTENINKWNYENLKANDENKNLELYRKLDIKLFSSIHKSKSRSNYFIIDVDKKDEMLLLNILSNFKDLSDIRWVSETRGGFHVIANRNEVTGKIIHEIIKRRTEFIEFRKECMTPTPGTLQGGFVVKEYIGTKN